MCVCVCVCVCVMIMLTHKTQDMREVQQGFFEHF